jgi:hypothetical protein
VGWLTLENGDRDDAPAVGVVAGGVRRVGLRGTTEDVGRAVTMLIRGELTYANGCVLRVDDGLTFNAANSHESSNG